MCFSGLKLDQENLRQLQELRVSLRDGNYPRLIQMSSWKGLHRLYLVLSKGNTIADILRPIANAVVEEKFPKLDTVCLVTRSKPVSVDLKITQRLRQRNVSVFSVDSESEIRQKDLDIVNQDTVVSGVYETLMSRIGEIFNDMKSICIAVLIAGGITLGMILIKR